MWDIGCGTGLNAWWIRAASPNACYVGVDASPAMLRRAPDYPNATWVCADALAWMAYQTTGSVDLILSTYCVDAWTATEQAAFVARAHDALTDGGSIGLITLAEPVTLAERVWTWAARLSPLVLGGSRPTNLNRLLVDAGFTLLHTARVTQFGVASRLTVARRL